MIKAMSRQGRTLSVISIYCGFILGNILTIVDPDLVVIGGGLSNFPAITTQLAERLPRHLLPVARVPRINGRATVMRGDRGAAFLHLTD